MSSVHVHRIVDNVLCSAGKSVLFVAVTALIADCKLDFTVVVEKSKGNF